MSAGVIRASTERGGVPLISVVLPVYNGEKYLAEAIDSILVQSFTNFELIIIDDGSIDNSLSILKHYHSLDTRIHLVTRENRNLVATLNESIDLARGEWIARMDQDDISLPNRFERQMQWLQKSKADICGSWVRYFGGSDRRTWRGYESDDAIKMDMLFKNPFAHPSVMMRTHLVKKLKYDPRSEMAEDYDLWVRAAQAGLKMTNVPEVLLMYRRHDFQISVKSSLAQQNVSGEIRKRYWSYAANKFGFGADHSEYVLNLFSKEATPNMDMANISFEKLLMLSSGEARVALVGNISRLYLKVATSCPNIKEKWKNLDDKFDLNGSLGVKFKLWIISLFKMKQDGKPFILLKKIYIFLASSLK